jgi:ABC-type multidrug transport system fused ATPase/permease subunit
MNTMKKFSKFIYIGALASFIVLLSMGYWFSNNYSSKEGDQQNTSENIHNNLHQVIQSGDIIFHTSTSSQSKAIQLATHSKYSHMGIIYQKGASFFVYEAVQPVKLTPLNVWIDRGLNGQYVVKRLQNADELINPQSLQRMQNIGERFSGKNYDLYFEWSDDKIYCSELVWKIYK